MAIIINNCAWCDKIISVEVHNQYLTPVVISHGICLDCKKKITEEDISLCIVIVAECGPDISNI